MPLCVLMSETTRILSAAILNPTRSRLFNVGLFGFHRFCFTGCYRSMVGRWKVRDLLLPLQETEGLVSILAEITTLVKYNMPVKLIILNNYELGKISKEQRAGEFDVWKTSLVQS